MSEVAKFKNQKSRTNKKIRTCQPSEICCLDHIGFWYEPNPLSNYHETTNRMIYVSSGEALPTDGKITPYWLCRYAEGAQSDPKLVKSEYVNEDHYLKIREEHCFCGEYEEWIAAYLLSEEGSGGFQNLSDDEDF